MPLYEYQCPKCGRFELIQKFSDKPLEKCPTCGAEVQKLLSAPAIQFKGTGWYITDYARKGAGGESKKDGGAAKESGAKDSASKESGSKESSSKDSKDTSSSSTAAKGSGGGTST